MNFGVDGTAKAEAKSFIRLLARGMNVQSVREMIAPGPGSDANARYRTAVLREFDLLALRVSFRSLRDGKIKFLRNTNETAPSSLLRDEVIKLLRQGLPHRVVHAKIPVPLKVIWELSKKIGAAYVKPHGARGRRFTREFRKKLREAVASGRRSAAIEREFGVDRNTVTRMRHALGDFENRVHWKKLTRAQIREAERQLRDGATWRDVARKMGCHHNCLLESLRYRKRAGSHHFTQAEELEVLNALRRVEGVRRIAERMGKPRSAVYNLVARLRKENPDLPPPTARKHARRRGTPWKTAAAA
jgi:transposase-like protein